MAMRLQFFSQLPIVVDLSIEDNAVPLVFGMHRLMPRRRHVKDREPGVPEHDGAFARRVMLDALVIWPPVPQLIERACQLFIQPVRCAWPPAACYSTHGCRS